MTKTMFDNIDKMARIERDIEKRMEAACEKDGWVVSVAMMPPERTTCAPRMQEKWSEANPTCGQCSITAFLVQDIFGGEVYGVPLGDGSYHCFNKVGDAVFDLTSEQFDHPLAYTMDFQQSRETHFAKVEKKARFETLKDALKRKAKS